MSTAQISTVIQPIAPRGEFRNEPFIDFHDSENVHAMQAALTRVGDMLGHEYELVIGGERSHTASKIESLNPSRPAQVVGVHQRPGWNTPSARCGLPWRRSRHGNLSQ